MFAIGCSFHVFSIFRYNFLISVVGTSADSYMWTASMVSLVSFFVSNAWLWIAQRTRKLFGTFLVAAIVASVSLESISAVPQIVWLRAGLFCLFFGCLKSFISIGACATIKNIPEKKIFGEQFVFFLIGTVPVNFFFSHLKLPDSALVKIWIVATCLCLFVCWLLGGAEYFDRPEEPEQAYSTVGASSSSVSPGRTPLLPSENASMTKIEQPQSVSCQEEGYLALFANGNFCFFIFVAFLIGYTCNTFIIFAPKLQQEDLALSNSQRTLIEYAGMASEITVYISFRHLFGSLKPYVLILVCMVAFFVRSSLYVLAVVISLLGGDKSLSFGCMLAGDMTKGLVFGMLQPAYITFVSWYSSAANRNIALAVYNGVFYGITGFFCGILSGLAKVKLSAYLKGSSSFKARFFSSNCLAFVIAQSLLVWATALVMFRYWIQKKGRIPEFVAPSRILK
jgi:hypothetical protein